MSDCFVYYLSDSPYAGGAEVYLRLLAEGLGPERAGLVAVDHPGLRDWITPWEEDGFAVVRLRPTGTVGLVKQLADFSRERRPDLVHLNAPGPYAVAMGLGPWALKWGGCRRVVVTEHLPTVGRVGKRFWSKRIGLGAVDRAISVCQTHRSVLRQVFGYSSRQAVAISNGIVDPRPRATTSHALDDWPAPRFVQVGSLDPRKGAPRLVEAFERAWRQDEAVGSLHLVGDGPLRSTLEEWVRERGLGEVIVVHGHRADVADVWASADAAVLCSHREGLPLSLLEAMAFSLPLLATKVDGVDELLVDGENGLLLAPSADLEQRLVVALLRMAESAEQCRRWGRRSRELFEEGFQVDRMRAQTYALYDEVLGGADLP